MSIIESIEGKVQFNRTTQRNCACCDGEGHIYARHIIIKPVASMVFPDSKIYTIKDWLSMVVIMNDELQDGDRVKITVEKIAYDKST